MSALNGIAYWLARMIGGTLALAFSAFVLGIVARVVVEAALLGWNLL